MNKVFFYCLQIAVVFTLCIAPFSLLAQKADTNNAATTLNSVRLIEQYREEACGAVISLNFELALEKIKKAKNLAINLQDSSGKGEIILSEAQLHYYLESYDKAAKLNSTAITQLKASQNTEKLANALSLQGFISTKLSEFSASENYFKQADALYSVGNNEGGKSSILLGRGILEFEKGNPEVALNYLNAGVAKYREFVMSFQEVSGLLYKAKALLQLEDDAKKTYLLQSKTALKDALLIIEAKNYNKLKIDSYQINSNIALKEGDSTKAKNLLEEYTAKIDALKIENISLISAINNSEPNGVEIQKEMLPTDEELSDKEKSESFNVITNGLSIAIIAILSLLTLSLYKNNNLRAKANTLLQDKNTELQLAKEKAEKASLAKAQFLSTITHELRTPLYAVTGLTHLLMEENPREHQREHLDSLKFSGEFLLSLINNILDLNKLEANKVEIEKISFHLKKRINDVLIALKKSANDKQTTLRVDYDDSIPESLSGDPVKLSQVLINLIGNSVKFTQNGEVVIRVRKIDQYNNSIKLNFEIEDNGVGISKKKQKTIFETFSQGSLQINRKFGGTGLGLSIVKNLLELMNSKIQLESKLGEGSKFWFNLDLDISDEKVSQQSKTEKKKVIDLEYLVGKNVLVVEDNKINQMITKKILEKNKMICQVADNGTDAVQLVKENDFDVVLMDIHMPGISGIEATQKIRGFNKALPIIALTAVTIDENLDEFFRVGFNEIIPKPFKPEEFFEKIHDTLKLNK
ncbi:ATP-binding protein, partial [Flavobacteriaceae bacterium]|nr:ATP-binding protein [Flavobacteriaceae bacterium]